ncbi:MAG: hypothetical protein A3F72_19000 [Bacteroidetes bacterium RIFCSPLOWO2_12_FULL_35_15]|nr:MAG: hypothetical protein A3F72_19000 [Bacteroidetes bacterium RIFCSPLOWO2_12_FULL_35_15]
MKKTLFIFFIFFSVSTSFAQTKAEQVDLNNIKRFYTRLKTLNIDTKQELLWEYTYSDTSETTLSKVGRVFEKENLKTVELKKSTQYPNKYILTVSEIKKYKTPELLNERVKYLNSIANIFKITDRDAIISAERQKKEMNIDSYKKIGKEKREKE